MHTRARLILGVLATACSTDNISDSADKFSGSGTPDWASTDIDCEAELAAPEWSEATCRLPEALTCGGTVQSNTLGGPSELDGGDYQSFYCAQTGSSGYQGSEQHIAFRHPGTGTVELALDSPCEDLDLFVMRWDDDSCVRSGLSIVECEGGIGLSNVVELWNNEPATYVLVVESESGEPAPFAVSARCPG